MLLGWVKQHYLWISDKEREEIFTPSKNSYFIGARGKCSPEDNNTELERTTHYFTFSSLWSYAATSVSIGMFCFAVWTGRQRFNSEVENVGKSPHCDCLRGVPVQLHTCTLPCFVPYNVHTSGPADSRKSMSAGNSAGFSFSCLLAVSVSYVFASEWASYAFVCCGTMCWEGGMWTGLAMSRVFNLTLM